MKYGKVKTCLGIVIIIIIFEKQGGKYDPNWFYLKLKFGHAISKLGQVFTWHQMLIEKGTCYYYDLGTTMALFSHLNDFAYNILRAWLTKDFAAISSALFCIDLI